MKYTAVGLGAVAIAILVPTLANAQNAPALRLYAEAGFGGESHRVDRGIENLDTLRFGDRARSMIAEGRWEVCLDANYRGGCRVVQGQVSDMGDWSARISSVRYLGPSDWGADADTGGTRAGVSGPVNSGADLGGSPPSGPTYRVDYRPEMIGGTYDTDFGRLVLQRYDRDGSAGYYAEDARDGTGSGSFEGQLEPADHPVDGHDTVEGYWFQQTSAQRCDSARNGTHYWGRFQFNFPRQGRDFIGFYGHCEESPLSRWNGTYVGRDAAIEAAVNAQMAGQPGMPVNGASPSTPVDAQGRPLPGVVERTARVAADEAERRVQDRVREGIGRLF
jgi:Beta/Gamma crystallin.